MNPLRITNTSLQPNVLLMVKIVALSYFIVYWRRIPGVYLPFLPILDDISVLIDWQVMLQTIFLLAFILLMINRWTRAACITLGLVIFASVLASRPFFHNNSLFAGCILFLAGLTKLDGEPWLVRYQVALVYFGAGLDKALDADWRYGQFFENWMVNILHHPIYIAIASWLPEMALAKLMSWVTIITELSLVIGFLVPHLYRWAIALGVVFHTAVLIFVLSDFGVFYYAMLSAYLAFVRWPVLPVTAACDRPNGLCRWARVISGALDGGQILRWRVGRGTPGLCPGGLHLILDGRVYASWHAWGMAIMLSPVTYFVVLLGVMGALRVILRLLRQ